jgi:hypothetical protein
MTITDLGPATSRLCSVIRSVTVARLTTVGPRAGEKA